MIGLDLEHGCWCFTPRPWTRLKHERRRKRSTKIEGGNDGLAQYALGLNFGSASSSELLKCWVGGGDTRAKQWICRQ